jgi:hypothetical protein
MKRALRPSRATTRRACSGVTTKPGVCCGVCPWKQTLGLRLTASFFAARRSVLADSDPVIAGTSILTVPRESQSVFGPSCSPLTQLTMDTSTMASPDHG